MRTYPTLPETYGAILAGEIRAVVFSATLFGYARNVLGQWPELRLVDTCRIANPGYDGLAVGSTDTELLGTLQAALESLKGDGTLTTLLERWALAAPPF